MQRLLLNFGINSKVYANRKQAGYKGMPDGRGGESLYFTRAGHELVVSKSNLLRFRGEIGFLVNAKQEKLDGCVGFLWCAWPICRILHGTVESIDLLGH